MRQDPAGEPITGIAVICPTKGETAPEGFTIIKTTPSGLTANLNSGNKGDEVYLCYTKRPGTPITGLAVQNLKETVNYDTSYTRVEITPSGCTANTNRGVSDEANPIFFAYRGGYQSYFGHQPGTYIGVLPFLHHLTITFSVSWY